MRKVVVRRAHGLSHLIDVSRNRLWRDMPGSEPGEQTHENQVTVRPQHWPTCVVRDQQALPRPVVQRPDGDSSELGCPFCGVLAARCPELLLQGLDLELVKFCEHGV